MRTESTMNCGNDLLVNFPTSRRQGQIFTVESTPSISTSEEQTNIPLSPSPPVKKKVKFSEVADMTHVDFPSSSELRQRWYTADDKTRFKRILARDVRRMISIVSSTPGECLSTEVLEACVGIEIFLSRDLAQRTREKRARHMIGVLNESGRQGRSERIDDERLSRVSEKTSRWARDRAFELAVGYWELFREMAE
mmetsp:Transcript_33369/g.66360  ORF Transcript_33369/g.66360 Transcript_33369/m.66360 type:complete len:195 (-) Transcript_33369:180-764(-)